MSVAILLADGFEEIEFVTVVDILRRVGVEVTVAGLRAGVIEGAHGVKVTAETTIDEITTDRFDAIYLPGGYPGFVNLGEDERVLKLVREMNRGGKYVVAICGAPTVLEQAGVIADRKVTCYPGVRDRLTTADYADQRVVVDGNIITSQGPGTSLEFALKLVEILVGRQKMETVRQETLAVC